MCKVDKDINFALSNNRKNSAVRHISRTSIILLTSKNPFCVCRINEYIDVFFLSYTFLTKGFGWLV